MLSGYISMWRAASLLLGLFSIWVATASSVAVLDERMLTAHMVQHLLLMTIAPPLIWLGMPGNVLTSAAVRWPLLRKFGKVVGNPTLCWLAATAALVGWHAPAAFRLAMQSGEWHTIEQVSFLVAGLLFWWPVFQPSPRWSILLYLFLATLPCDVLSGFLVFSGRIVYPVYLCIPRHPGLSVLEDQQCAGALMWTVVTVAYVVAGTVFAARLLGPHSNPEPVEVS